MCFVNTVQFSFSFLDDTEAFQDNLRLDIWNHCNFLVSCPGSQAWPGVSLNDPASVSLLDKCLRKSNQMINDSFDISWCEIF